MAGPLLETKLHAPRRRSLVARPRLTERLNRGAESALTLVSAPAGFGKTTLLAEWLAAAATEAPLPSDGRRPTEDRSVAWLSLDARDNDPAVFWTYLITALRTAAPEIGSGSLSLLQSPQAPIDAVLASLLNDLDALPNNVVLVLDDFHLIDALAIQDGMAFLLEHLPAHAHLVIAGRADPALPLARLRARGELAEIRAAELRFTAGEAAAYLNTVMGLTLSASDVAALEGRTEGWIAALQLAALSMQGREDVTAFISGFAGDDRYIVDYLAEEVLNRQPDHVKRFLLQTSILDRLSGPLCDAVTGQDGGKANLAALERGNLFLVPLDDRRHWYRYHQLFADVLQAHLLDEQPASIADLHGRASVWFEQNGQRSEAINHALAAGDFDRAADLVELSIPAMRMSRQETAVRGWFAMLPESVVRVRPVLSAAFAGTLLSVGELDGVEAPLRDAERWLADAAGNPEGSAAAKMVVVDEAEFGRLPAIVELYRAAMGLAIGDLPGAIDHAQHAIERSPLDDHLIRAAAAGLLGLAYWTGGDLDAGHSAYAQCMAGLYLAGHVADTFGCAIALADIRVAQGRLGGALRTYEEALRRSAQPDAAVLRGTADMYVGSSEIARERNDLPAAAAFLLRSQELGEQNGLPQNQCRYRVAMARIREAAGDLDGAIDLLNDAERLYVSDLFPNVRPIPALRARIWVAQGRLTEAVEWAGERGLDCMDDLTYVREFEHITLARILLAAHRKDPGDHTLDELTRFLDRLLQAAEHGGRTGTVIEILVLQSLAGQTRANLTAALASLRRALTLAEPEAYGRIFINEGPWMATVLKAAAQQGICPTYVRSLLAAMDAAGATTAIRQGLIDPLSARELDVLRLLATDLDGPDIARRLIVSLNTVRTHTRNIYAKLGVNNRRAAVRKANELHLMSRSP